MKTRFKTVLSVLLLVMALFSCQACQAQEGQPSVLSETVSSVEKRISEVHVQFLAASAEVEAVMKQMSTDASKMTGKWRELVERSYSSPAVVELAELLPALDRAIERVRFGAVQAGNIGPDIAQEVYDEAEELLRFSREIQDAGRVIGWILQINRHISSIQHDIASAPVRMAAYVDEMKGVGEKLTEMLRVVPSSTVGMSESELAALKGKVREYEKESRQLMAVTTNAQVSLLYMVEAIRLDTAEQLDEEFKIVEKIVESWRNSGDLYPLIAREITEGVARWAPLPKARLDLYKKSRADYMDAYAAFFKEELFKGIPHFEGKKFAGISAVADEAHIIMLSLLTALEGQEKDMARRKKALKDDALITAMEREQIRRYDEKYGPEVYRRLKRVADTAAGGKEQIDALKRYLEDPRAQNDDPPAWRQEAKSTLEKLERRQHPEQIEADYALSDFVVERVEAVKAMRMMMEDHAKRKRSLGLEPALIFEPF